MITGKIFMLMEEEKMGFELQSFLTSVIPTGFDLNQKMSMPSLIFVGLNLLITIAIPVVFFIYLRKHAKLDLKGILIGGLVYIFMNQIMLNLVGILILMIPGVQAYMQANMFVSQSISVILSVAMEFLAILLGMMWMRRRQLTFNDCVMFLLGYSCIIILTETIAQSLAMLINCIMINTQGLTAIFAQIPDTDVDMAVQAYQSVLSAHPVEFLIDGINCLVLFLIRICCCILIYTSLVRKSGKQNLWIALLILILYNVPIALYGVQIVPSRVAVEIAFVVVTAVAMYYTYTVLKNELADDWKDFLSGKNKQKKNNQPKKMPKIVMPKD